ncbi:hypothetical protein QCD71_14805 [Sphingomonas sp. PsM26]|nr:hypothetical protein [Sphingomonas sp. PsM26]
MEIQTEAPLRPLDRDLCNDIDSLESTAEYIDVLCPIILDEISRFRESVRSVRSVPAIISDGGEWRNIETLLMLLWRQNDIVKDTVGRFAIADRRGLSL